MRSVDIGTPNQTPEAEMSVLVWQVVNLGGFIELASTAENQHRQTAYPI
ncbi:MAG UNVERIFIED_CONTAM: hypothetical protein LVT10_00540 [Anaerolineae bacterium]